GEAFAPAVILGMLLGVGARGVVVERADARAVAAGAEIPTFHANSLSMSGRANESRRCRRPSRMPEVAHPGRSVTAAAERQHGGGLVVGGPLPQHRHVVRRRWFERVVGAIRLQRALFVLDLPAVAAPRRLRVEPAPE